MCCIFWVWNTIPLRLKLTAKAFLLLPAQPGADVSLKQTKTGPRQVRKPAGGLLHAALFSGTIAALLRLLLILHKSNKLAHKLHLLRRKTGRKLDGALVAAVHIRGVAPV